MPSRCEAKIAPRPTLPSPPVSFATMDTYHGPFTALQRFSSLLVTCTYPTNSHKRGQRRKKNPELSETERALIRGEQNRESSCLSRVPREVVAAEYEWRLNGADGLKNSQKRAGLRFWGSPGSRLAHLCIQNYRILSFDLFAGIFGEHYVFLKFSIPTCTVCISITLGVLGGLSMTATLCFSLELV